jgi:Protein of unknown function (DUF4058)
MASPFPGMDPYLEDPACWRDFHQTFIGCWREAVADQLPESYHARLDESINLVQMSPEVIKLIYPDIALTRKKRAPRSKSAKGGTLLLEPVTLVNEFLEEVRQTRIEILHRPNRSLVAVLEMLSPANKTGDGFQEYRAKRKAVLQQKVHLVELDLLVGGNRVSFVEPLPEGDYFAMISRANKRPDCEVYSWTVRQPLPTIPIPLKTPEADVLVDLSKVFQVAYERGRYAGELFYGQVPSAPLRPADAKWAKAMSAKK